MQKVIVYPASHVYYDGVISAVNSALANANVDEIWIMTDGEPFPYKVPFNVHVLDVSNQQWIKRDSPNWRNDYAFICLVRVALAKMFPDLDMILSLDADTIITQDISELWDLDLDDYYLAGVPEMKLSEQYRKPYINAGMMLFNLDKIRDDHMDDQMIEDLNHRWWQWVEQDCINRNCEDGIMVLPSTYNDCQFTAPCDNAKILHFAYTFDWKDYSIVKKYREGQNT